MSDPKTETSFLDPSTYKYFATTVGLITSHHEGRGSNVMACEWTFNISWSPLVIMVLVGQEDMTHELISASGEFGVNLCSEHQAALASLAGNVTGYKYNKLADPLFADVVYPAQHIKAPMIRGCTINAECVVERTVEFGDYTGYVGRAVAAKVDPSLRPLLYHRSKYFQFGNQVVKPKVSAS